MIKKKSAGGGTRDQQTIKKKYIYQHGGKRLGRSFEREKGDSRRRGRGMEVVSAAEEKEEVNGGFGISKIMAQSFSLLKERNWCKKVPNS